MIKQTETPARKSLSRRHVTAGLSMLLAGTALSGCGIKLPGSGDPARIYVLTPKSTFDDDIPSVSWQLLVEPPLAAAGISSSRIALRRSLIELEYFGRAAWTDSAPNMVQTLMIESFENSNRIVSVGRQAIGLRSDFILKTDLREFQAEYVDADGQAIPDGGAPLVRVRMNAKLVMMPQRSIVGSRTVEYLIQAPGPSMVEIVQGFDEALGKILKRMISWTLIEGERIYQAERAAQADQSG